MKNCQNDKWSFIYDRIAMLIHHFIFLFASLCPFCLTKNVYISSNRDFQSGHGHCLLSRENDISRQWKVVTWLDCVARLLPMELLLTLLPLFRASFLLEPKMSNTSHKGEIRFQKWRKQKKTMKDWQLVKNDKQ